MKLAIENHKGWRAAEHAAWVKQVGSEYVGVCYDFGNNIALCEDPAETYQLLAPLTFYVSFKDMAVAPYDEGFLLSEVALGEGMLDIPGMVKGLQQRDPNMIFALEMITREPLKIPGVHEEVLGDLRRRLQPAAGPRPGPGAGDRPTRRKKPLTTTAGLTPAAGAEARGRSDQPLDRLRAQESCRCDRRGLDAGFTQRSGTAGQTLGARGLTPVWHPEDSGPISAAAADFLAGPANHPAGAPI